MPDFLSTKIAYLKGVGPIRAELLANHLAILTIGDILSHYPIRYEDRTSFVTISQLQPGIWQQFKATVHFFSWEGTGKSARLKVVVYDTSGSIELVWFTGGKWIEEKLKPNSQLVIFGKPQIFRNTLSISHPEMEDPNSFVQKNKLGLSPVYPLTELLRKRHIESKLIADIVRTIFEHPNLHIPETLPQSILNQNGFISKARALKLLHLPQNAEQLNQAKNRLKYEELFYLQIRHLQLKQNNKRNYKGLIFSQIGHYFNSLFHHHLPFALTKAQMQVIKEIRHDMGSGEQMNRLLQGDVGSGKTIVALLCALIALDNTYQTCFMAPTEILAAQHFNSLKSLVEPIGAQIEILTGSTTKKQRLILFERLKKGEIHILVGTHALLEDNVEYNNLGLVIIDEQHRFGVAQRAKLWKKGATYVPHILVMTATPIPRTLALTVYGELDISTIDQLPQGRKPIKTVHRYAEQVKFIFDFVAEQIALGRQAYVVYPLIDESEKLEAQSLMSGYDEITQYLPTPTYTYSMVHGKMKPAEKENQMQLFINHKTDIMVATTVIEVGVNVPNASIMVIMNAERFGLAQLHQLRGRVGRGSDQSYCILVSGSKLSKNAQTRIQTMVKSTDGFYIAKIDMELRGPGDLDGTKQSGILDLKLADLQTDEELITITRNTAQEILNQDPFLNNPQNLPLKTELQKMPNRTVWSKIS